MASRNRSSRLPVGAELRGTRPTRRALGVSAPGEHRGRIIADSPLARTSPIRFLISASTRNAQRRGSTAATSIDRYRHGAMQASACGYHASTTDWFPLTHYDVDGARSRRRRAPFRRSPVLRVSPSLRPHGRAPAGAESHRSVSRRPKVRTAHSIGGSEKWQNHSRAIGGVAAK